MAIELHKGDMFAKYDAGIVGNDAMVNAVNCVGIMGRGVALEFKRRFPAYFRDYELLCEGRRFRIGSVHAFETHNSLCPWIVGVPTKRHWADQSRVLDVEAGIDALVEWTSVNKIHSISIPALGAGLGGLPWLPILSYITHAFARVPDVHVDLYEPQERQP